MEVAEFIDRALLNGGKVYVNCVFGVSRSTTCIVAYLMLALDWDPLRALEHIRRKRPVRCKKRKMLIIITVNVIQLFYQSYEGQVLVFLIPQVLT